MSRENPFENPPQEDKKEEGSPIHDGGFTMSGEPYYSTNSEGQFKVEFRPGETNEGKIKENEEALQKEVERTKGFTDADHAEEMMSSMLESSNPYSETFKIKSDGKFDQISRADDHPVYFGVSDTPAGLYQIAAEIEQKHPEYKFSFETDPEGKWFKYTVLKSESQK